MEVSKQARRMDKKKLKLAALANLVKLNENDRPKLTNYEINQVIYTNDKACESVTNANKRKHELANDKPDLESDDVQKTDTDDGFIQVSRRQTIEQKRAKVMPHTEVEPLVDNDKILSNEQYKDLKRQLQQRKQLPRMCLTDMGARALLTVDEDQRTPIFLTDIQHLVARVLFHDDAPCKPQRWCYVEHASKVSKIVVLSVEGLSLYHYHAFASAFPMVYNIFQQPMELVVPPVEHGSLLRELAQVPLMMTQANELIEMHGSLDAALDMCKDPMLLVQSIFPIDKESAASSTIDADLHPDDRFPRTKLLLSALQMVDEGYPMPLRGELGVRFKHYKFTKSQYSPVTNRSPMFGIDCEMCLTSHSNELTRISVVNEKMETLYETLVRPRYPIVDYLTRYSGITKEMMLGATKTLADVQADISDLLPSDAILVGQSLNSDLNAMQMMHPYVIDTSVCFNLSGVRKRKSKLKLLSEKFLKELIQENADGHDSVEDSKATLKLVKLKLSEGLDFGDEILLRKRRYQEVMREGNAVVHVKPNLMQNKTVAIISHRSSLNDKWQMPPDSAIEGKIIVHKCRSNKKVFDKTREIASNHSLVLINIRIESDKIELETEVLTMQRVDKCINKLWKKLPHNGMLVVVFGGSKACPSGLAQIAFKNNTTALSVSEVPKSSTNSVVKQPVMNGTNE